MHKKHFRLMTFFLALGAALNFNCLENPFGSKDEIRDKRQTSGQVVYPGGGAAAGVFVWLDIYNLSTYTDAEGKFLLVLPATQSRQGIVEEGLIYFYIANFQLATARVKISEGEFMPLEGDLDKQSQVRESIVMRRAVNIVTQVIPASLPADTSFLLIRASVVADEGCAIVYNPLMPEVPYNMPDTAGLGAAIFRHLASGDFFIVRLDPEGRANERIVPCSYDSLHRELAISINQLPAMPAGKYEVIPYLLCEPENTPSGLLAKLGLELNELGANYLKKPMRRTGGAFEIR